MNRFISFAIPAAIMICTASMAWADPDPVAAAIYKKLMAATIANDYDAFLAESDDLMKAALTKTMLEKVSKDIASRAQQGYDSQYFGVLNQGDYKVHLWRLQFKDGGDDLLAILSVKNGKAGGFYVR